MAPTSINTLTPPFVLLPPSPPNGILNTTTTTKRSSAGLIAAGVLSALLAFAIVIGVYYFVHRRNVRARLPMQSPPAVEELSFESSSMDTEIVTPIVDSPPMVQKTGLRPLLLPTTAQSKQLPKRLLLPVLVSRKHMLHHARTASMPPPPSNLKSSTTPRFPFGGKSYRHSVAHDASCLRKLLELDAKPLQEACLLSDSLRTARVDTVAVDHSQRNDSGDVVSGQLSDSSETVRVNNASDSSEPCIGTNDDGTQDSDGLKDATVGAEFVDKPLVEDHSEEQQLSDNNEITEITTVDKTLDTSFFETPELTWSECDSPRSPGSPGSPSPPFALPPLVSIFEDDEDDSGERCTADKVDSAMITGRKESFSDMTAPTQPSRPARDSVPDMSDFLQAFENEIEVFWSKKDSKSIDLTPLDELPESYYAPLPEYECISDGETAPDWGIFTTREELSLRDDDVAFYTWMADDPGASTSKSTPPSLPREETEGGWPQPPVLEISNSIRDKSISFDQLLSTKRSKKSTTRPHLIFPITYLTKPRSSRFSRVTTHAPQKSSRKSSTKDRRTTLYFSLGAMNTAIIVASQISESSPAAISTSSRPKSSKKAIRHVGSIKRRKSVKPSTPFTFQKDKKSKATRKWRDYRKLSGSTPTLKITKTSDSKPSRSPLGRITNTCNNLLTAATGIKLKPSPPPSPTLLINGLPVEDTTYQGRGGLTEPLMDEETDDPSLLNLAWEPKSRFHKVHITVNLKKRAHAPDAAHGEENDPAFDPLRVQTYIENPLSDFRNAVELHYGCSVIFRGAMPLGMARPLYVPLVNDQYFRRWINHYYQQGFRKLKLDAWRRENAALSS
ncbi:hypothetical protein SCHPADRAFT_1000057 [Schizopora paradoxa]|uniref:Uncharacterized protein n=1 Tax=Schizopora paradoxa TaxID=27342 RepID=A0A0H2RY84_9AGAM|nr:hypothetical protein SCHPADRAFT_1000057 [Schizopora paradoxa]